jgi:hypothetical protein
MEGKGKGKEKERKGGGAAAAALLSQFVSHLARRALDGPVDALVGEGGEAEVILDDVQHDLELLCVRFEFVRM